MKRAQVLEELAAVYAELAGEHDTAGPVGIKITYPQDRKEVSLDEKLVRLALGEACIEFLKTRRKPQYAKDIWSALEAAGRTSEAVEPIKSVSWALKKLVRNGHEDLFSPGFGTWQLKSNYSPHRLKKLLESTAGRGGRTSSEHSEKTKTGIEKRRAEGKPVGAPRRYTVEHIRAWHCHIADGKSIKDACELAGISYPTYNQNNKAIKAWREGDPWPLPEERLKELEGPHVRLVASKE